MTGNKAGLADVDVKDIEEVEHDKESDKDNKAEEAEVAIISSIFPFLYSGAIRMAFNIKATIFL